MTVNNYQTFNTYLHKTINNNIHTYFVDGVCDKKYWKNFNEKVYMQTGEFGEDFWDICEHKREHC